MGQRGKVVLFSALALVAAVALTFGIVYAVNLQAERQEVVRCAVSDDC